jgi:hypothetical protein
MRKLIFLFLFLSFQFVFALTITEIIYNPEGNDSGREWIEVFNNSSETINILSGKNGWRINDGNNHLFEENLTVYPQEIFVILQDKSLFLKDYPNFQGKIIQANFSLKNESGKIQIFDEQKRLRAEISYQSSCGGQGNGYSIFFENNVCKENKIKGGTPGNLLVKDEGKTEELENKQLLVATSASITILTSSMSMFQSVTSTIAAIPTTSSISTFSTTSENMKTFKPTLIISEFLPNPEGNDQDKEFVEILNYGNEAIDLNSFVLEIGKKKINLKGRIEPKEYFVISNKDNNFYIHNHGETLKLYFDDQEIFSVSYDGKASEGKSFSRKEDGLWEFTEPTPGKENTFIKNADLPHLLAGRQGFNANLRGLREGSIQKDINNMVGTFEKLAQTTALPTQKIEEKTEIFYILGGLIIILILVFIVWFKL